MLWRRAIYLSDDDILSRCSVRMTCIFFTHSEVDSIVPLFALGSDFSWHLHCTMNIHFAFHSATRETLSPWCSKYISPSIIITKHTDLCRVFIGYGNRRPGTPSILSCMLFCWYSALGRWQYLCANVQALCLLDTPLNLLWEIQDRQLPHHNEFWCFLDSK